MEQWGKGELKKITADCAAIWGKGRNKAKRVGLGGVGDGGQTRQRTKMGNPLKV